MRQENRDSEFAYNMYNIDEISEELEIPWKKSKGRAFTSSNIYIRLKWDLPSCTVALANEKVEKYQKVIQKWRKQLVFNLQDIQKLHGKLLHTTMVDPEEQAYLVALEAMLPGILLLISMQ